jgi:hypothetical protein
MEEEYVTKAASPPKTVQKGIVNTVILLIFIPGRVALVVGGDSSLEVELYSPEGKCNILLKPVPAQGPIL